MTPTPPTESRLLQWADRLLYAGLALALLTAAVPYLSLLTFFLAPCCFWLSWVGYVAQGQPASAPATRWLRVGLAAVAAHGVLFWMSGTGYLVSALVCGAELLLALGWQASRGRGRWRVAATATVVLAGWATVAGLGLVRGSLYEAVRKNDVRWAQALLWSGADPNQVETEKSQFMDGQPVLYHALFQEKPSPALVGLLLRHGAHPNARWVRADGSLIEPVGFALAHYQRPRHPGAVLRLLLQAGLNPCLPNQHGENLRTALAESGALAPADSAALAAAERRGGCR
ncbi:hypothetical protein ACFST9_00755 [Hymenobacter monticola]|uniref:Ankyrin repeat domain-containing protein n=1 Tax=Hymenobacter monticola TaxID=1705399 RepID=A0ABY4B663_9BACT|nr:hypothetical protein [Hymenobacter monticola]UOE33506.1 hypothetical protein MTP16_20575 [Hymenobacter monticola]